MPGLRLIAAGSTGLPNELRYPLAFVLPLVATLLLTPVAARMARRLGVLDHPDERKFHVKATPYFGGLAVAGGLVVSAAVTTGSSRQLPVILGAALGVGFMGLIDDFRTLGPLVKLAVESAGGLILWFAGVRAGLFGLDAPNIVLTVIWVVAVTNAFNLVDNMDGLAAGVATIAGLAFFAIAVDVGHYLVASFALAVAGASLGFLRHNFAPARVFMGDAGSLLLGFLLAAIGLKLDLVGESGLVRTAIPVLILAVPFFDLLLVIVARLRDHRPIYVGGIDHSSHRMAVLGFSPRAIALGIYGVELLCSGAAIWLLHASIRTSWLVGLSVATVAAATMILLLSVQTDRQLRVPRTADILTADVVTAEAESGPVESPA